jgi:hypothetical protein
MALQVRGEMMELADPRMIEELMATHARISGARQVRRKRCSPPPAASMEAARCPKVKRCRCGTCARCVEEARWERIFNERFADPNYYKNRPTTFGSSLGWLGRPAS